MSSHRWIVEEIENGERSFVVYDHDREDTPEWEVVVKLDISYVCMGNWVCTDDNYSGEPCEPVGIGERDKPQTGGSGLLRGQGRRDQIADFRCLSL